MSEGAFECTRPVVEAEAYRGPDQNIEDDVCKEEYRANCLEASKPEGD
jgi:hypothetical protein